jgi:hypothetical protein
MPTVSTVHRAPLAERRPNIALIADGGFRITD